jgi:AcrR family transcriptional regulator
LEDILDAAIELGLTRISMSALAEKLGVATATIYNYVESRDDLIRLAAAAQARRPQLDDLGQHWSELVRTYANEIFELCSAEPQLLVQGIHGAMGPEAQLDHVESFLAALVRRGFSISEAYQLFSSINNVILGAVVRTASLRAMNASEHGHEGAVRRSLAERGLEELPHVRACPDLADEVRAFSFKSTVERIIQSFATDPAGRHLPGGNGGARPKPQRRVTPHKLRITNVVGREK